MTDHDLSHYGPVPAGRPWVPPSQRTGALARETRDTVLPYSYDVHPQMRTTDTGGASISQSASIPAVYRALEVLTTAAGQLPLTVERQGKTLRGRQVPSLIHRPALDMSTSEFVQAIVLSLAVSGNAYLHADRVDGQVVSLDVWNPHQASRGTDRQGRLVYWYNGREYAAADVQHLTKLKLPGSDIGLGPIQAASQSLGLAVRQRRVAEQWFDTSGQPNGILTSDQEMSSADARRALNFWNGMDADGNPVATHANPSGIKVLSKGLNYKPILISPKDAMWLDAMNFSTLEVCRLFGVPTSLMYAAIEGNSMTYTNVEQEWLAFVRFTLMDYIRPIEDALTELVPYGQRVKFNIEGLLRTDTRTRYDAHAVGLAAGFLTINEVRSIEGLEPLPGGDTAQPATTRPHLSEDNT